MNAQQQPFPSGASADSADIEGVEVREGSACSSPETLPARRRAECDSEGAHGRPAKGKHPAVLDHVSWSPPTSITFEQWVIYGRRLGSLGRTVGWWIGDWLRFGNTAYGEKYVRASRITGYDVQTLMNMTYVATSIDPSRRRENLSWSHHAEVAALPVDEQEAWLSRAEEKHFSVHDLRLEVRQKRNRESGQALTDPSEEGRSDIQRVTTCPQCGHTFREVGKRQRAHVTTSASGEH